MMLKTVRGNNIPTAMAEARRLYGDDIILMQTTPAEGNRQAEIIISMEERMTVSDIRSQRASTDDLAELAGRQLGYGRPQPRPAATRFSAQRPPAEHSSAIRVAQRRANAPMTPSKVQPSAPADHPATELAPSPETAPAPETLADRIGSRVTDALTGLGGLVRSWRPTRDEDALIAHVVNNAKADADSPAQDASDTPRPVRYLEALDRRMASIERSLSSAMIGYDARWRQNPLFGDLIDAGLSVETASALIASVAARGISASANSDDTRRELSDELRKRMKVVVARKTQGRHLFVGPSGAGKTSMIAGLAASGRIGRTLVVILAGPMQSNRELIDPSVYYDAAGVDSISVHSRRQLEIELQAINAYDSVVIDAPSLTRGDAETTLAQAHELLEPLGQIVTHYVVDVRSNFAATERALTDAIDAIDAIALTHLDELDQPGRLADFFTQTRRPIYFASNAGGNSAGTHIFSPAKLASDVVGLEPVYKEAELTEYFERPRQARSLNDALRPYAPAIAAPLDLHGRR